MNLAVGVDGVSTTSVGMYHKHGDWVEKCLFVLWAWGLSTKAYLYHQKCLFVSPVWGLIRKPLFDSSLVKLGQDVDCGTN